MLSCDHEFVAGQEMFEYDESATTTMAVWCNSCHNSCTECFDVDDNGNGEDQMYCWEDLVL